MGLSRDGDHDLSAKRLGAGRGRSDWASMNDILVLVLSAEADEPALAAAATLKRELGATHVAALSLSHAIEPQDCLLTPEAAVWADLAFVVGINTARMVKVEKSLPVIRQVRRYLGHAPLRQIDVYVGGESIRTSTEARCASIVVMTRPAAGPEEAIRRAIFESILFESGRPVLLAPPQWRQSALTGMIIVAWDGSRAAARALADSLPLLAQADSVLVFSVETGARSGPSAIDIAGHLRRLGVRCHHRTVTATRADIEKRILDECAALDAGLLVMGGYGHSRWSEWLLGGVTRSLLQASPIPLFLSH